MKFSLYKKYISLLFISFFLIRCTDDLPTDNEKVAEESFAQVLQPGNNTKATCGQELAVKISVQKIDSLKSIDVFWNDTLVKQFTQLSKTLELGVKTQNALVGKNDLKVVFHEKNGRIEEDNRTIVLFSDIFSDIQVAKIKQIFPHDKSSYTQGLEFYNGVLFEGTGLVGKSILAKVKLQDGSFIQKINLPNNVFGEGITVLNGKIYQLTWQARVCYEYDAKTLEKLREFTYFGEGWGLCNNGKEILMSNGTSEISFHNTENFEKTHSIYVFDSNKEYVSINELEFYKGAIYANVYQENFILKIDPNTGKVLAKIDCSDVEKQGRELGDVLNGIAINKENGKFYITGKQWPKLFEVSFENP
jgi:glutamine cyclotransferase